MGELEVSRRQLLLMKWEYVFLEFWCGCNLHAAEAKEAAADPADNVSHL